MSIPYVCALPGGTFVSSMGHMFVVRHGQASDFEDNYDRPSTLGEKQARLLGEIWARRGLRIDRVFSGPRVRQQRTAEIAAEAGGLPSRVVIEELDEMGVEPLFREALPELFERHAHLRALGDAMLAAEGNEARGGAIARLFEAALQLWVRGEVKTSGVEQWIEFRARVRKALAAVRSDARGRRLAAFPSAGPLAAPPHLPTRPLPRTA